MLLNKACLFPLYIVGFKFYSVTTDKVAPALKFKSALSKEKILRLNFLRSNLKSNLAKFVNLTSNFTHRDPHLENVNLKTCSTLALSHPFNFSFTRYEMATSRPYEERAVGLERVSASQTRSCKQTGAGLPPAVTSAKARNKRKGRSTLASLRSLPSPYGLKTASLIAAPPKAASRRREAKPLPLPKKKRKVDIEGGFYVAQEKA